VADRITEAQDGSGLPMKYHDNGDGTFSPVVYNTASFTSGRTQMAPDGSGFLTRYQDLGDGSFAPTISRAP
jgi:hypothetical protein